MAMLGDADAEIQGNVLAFWHSALPRTLSGRLAALLCDNLDMATSWVWLMLCLNACITSSQQHLCCAVWHLFYRSSLRLARLACSLRAMQTKVFTAVSALCRGSAWKGNGRTALHAYCCACQPMSEPMTPLSLTLVSHSHNV